MSAEWHHKRLIEERKAANILMENDCDRKDELLFFFVFFIFSFIFCRPCDNPIFITLHSRNDFIGQIDDRNLSSSSYSVCLWQSLALQVFMMFLQAKDRELIGLLLRFLDDLAGNIAK